MRTLIIIVGGLLSFGVCLLVAHWLSAASANTIAAKVFIPLWLLAAACNMWVGVSRAGYSITEELPIFLIIFAIPAVVASLVWWKYG